MRPAEQQLVLLRKAWTRKLPLRLQQTMPPMQTDRRCLTECQRLAGRLKAFRVCPAISLT
jgi:hypothetical protein